MKKILIFTILAALAGAALFAQEERIAGPALPCPRPVSVTVLGGSTPPTPDPADLGTAMAAAGSQWNQTAINKHFGHTFRFPAPPRECCLMTSGTLTIKVKALQGGPGNSSTSANDSFNLVSNGAVISQQQPWLTTGVATGTIATLTFTVPANVLNTGRVSIFTQDDSAVISASLSLKGCCLR